MNGTSVVYRKEIRDLLRDRRVRTAIFFGPMFLVLLLSTMFSLLADSLGSGGAPRKVYVVGANGSSQTPENDLVKLLKKDKTEVIPLPDDATARAWIRQGKVHVALEFEPDFETRIQANQPSKVHVLFNPSEPTGQIAAQGVRQTIESFDKDHLKAMLTSKNIDPATAETAVYDEVKVTPKGAAPEGPSEFMGQFLPYMLVIWAFYGGMSSSAELVAGEKEKNTLETLLISPVLRSQVAFGKFLALGSICLLSSISCLVGLAIAPLLPLPGAHKIMGGGGVSLEAAGVIFLIILPAAALYASIMLAVSAYARNTREAGTQLSLLSFVVLMPALFSQFIGYTDYANAEWVAFVPVLDSVNTIRHALEGKFLPSEIWITFLLNCFLAAITVWFAVRLFNQEKILGK